MTEDEKKLFKELIEKLDAQKDKKKDFWDRFGAISTFLSTVVLAALGLYFTNDVKCVIGFDVIFLDKSHSYFNRGLRHKWCGECVDIL